MALATIDLIPAAYREECKARRLLKWYIPVIACLLLGIGGARLSLRIERNIIEQELEALRADIATDAEMRQRYTLLAQTRDDLVRQVKVLDGLRGGPPAKRMFAAIERAANGDTWFRKWTFQRSGEIVNEQPASVHTGYLIVLTPPQNDLPERAWRLDTHMEIAGSALNHSALATFVARLAQQPEITDARILRTGSRRDADGEVVDFELAITVKPASEA